MINKEGNEGAECECGLCESEGECESDVGVRVAGCEYEGCESNMCTRANEHTHMCDVKTVIRDI